MEPEGYVERNGIPVELIGGPLDGQRIKVRNLVPTIVAGVWQRPDAYYLFKGDYALDRGFAYQFSHRGNL